MKDTSFEQLWRKALESASETPPESVWRGIDSQLSAEDEIESLFARNLRNASTPPPASVWGAIESSLDQGVSIEKQFQEKFEDATAIVPVGLWDRIEAELDDERKPVVIWFTRPWLVAGMAAALLLAFLFPLQNYFNSGAGVDATSSNLEINAESESAKGESQTVLEQQNQTVLADKLNEEISESASLVAKTNTRFDGSDIVRSSNIVQESITFQGGNITKESASIALVEEEGDNSLLDKLSKSLDKNISLLKGMDFSPYGNSFVLSRNKLEVPNSFVEAEEEAADTKKSWLGFVSRLAPFDPNIQISNFERDALVTARNVPSSFYSYNSVIETTASNSQAETFEIPLSQPFNDVRPGNSINLGLDYGVKLHKNVSVEVGARYNRGVSFIESNVYNYNRVTGDVSSFLTTHYIQKDRSVFNNTVISSSQDTKNAYQFLMVPVQLGIQVPLFDKFEAGVNAGVSGDFLVNNVLNDLPEGGSRLNSRNSAYRMANVSALAGLSLNYDINDSWQASLGGNFQQALRSGVAQSQNFSFIPRYIGVNYGINYRLK